MIIKVADWVTDLMQLPPENILIGRTNANREVFTTDNIVVDILSQKPYGTTIEYENEIQTRYTLVRSYVTLEFYGSNCKTLAYKFLGICNSQFSKDIAKTYGLTAQRPNNVNTLPQIIGEDYYDRYEVEFNIYYKEQIDIPVLQIDEVNITYKKGD